MDQHGIAVTARELKTHLWKKCRLYKPGLEFHHIEGILVKAPEREDRAGFVLAYDSEIPCYDPKNTPKPSETAIAYMVLRLEFLRNLRVRDNGIVIDTTNFSSWLTGGYFTDPEQIGKIRARLNKKGLSKKLSTEPLIGEDFKIIR